MSVYTRASCLTCPFHSPPVRTTSTFVLLPGPAQLPLLTTQPQGHELVITPWGANSFRGAAIMPLCAWFLNIRSQTQTLNTALLSLSWFSDHERVIDLKQQSRCDKPKQWGRVCGEGGHTVPPWGLVSSPENSQQFIFLVLGLNLPFVHCHCAALCVTPPPSGIQERLPPGACVPQILAVVLHAKRPCCRRSLPLYLCTALEPLVSGGELAGLIYLSVLAPVMAIVCIVTSSATWGLGMEQGQHELLGETVNLKGCRFKSVLPSHYARAQKLSWHLTFVVSFPFLIHFSLKSLTDVKPCWSLRLSHLLLFHIVVF